MVAWSRHNVASGPEHPCLFRDMEVAVLGTWGLLVVTRDEAHGKVSRDRADPGLGPRAAGGIRELCGGRCFKRSWT